MTTSLPLQNGGAAPYVLFVRLSLSREQIVFYLFHSQKSTTIFNFFEIFISSIYTQNFTVFHPFDHLFIRILLLISTRLAVHICLTGQLPHDNKHCCQLLVQLRPLLIRTAPWSQALLPVVGPIEALVNTNCPMIFKSHGAVFFSIQWFHPNRANTMGK